MKKIVLVACFIITCFLAACVQTPESQVRRYMEAKYNEDFTVINVWKKSHFNAFLVPEKHPEIIVRASFEPSNPDSLSDDYVQKYMFYRYSQDLEQIASNYLPGCYVYTNDPHTKTYQDTDINIDIKDYMQNNEYSIANSVIYVEEKNFSYEKAYAALCKLRSEYSNLRGTVSVVVVVNNTIADIRDLIDACDDFDTVNKMIIGNGQSGAMNLQGPFISYNKFVEDFDDFGMKTQKPQI